MNINIRYLFKLIFYGLSAMPIECDVLVVGGGPAGSSAARSAAKKGATTIIIDKKIEIGNPVQCAEGIGEYLFPYLPFEIPKEQLIWKMEGMSFWADDITIEKKGDFWRSYSLNRKEFDKWLSNLAIDEGAKLFTNTELIDFEFDEDFVVKKALVNTDGKIQEIVPRSVVAADGVESKALDLLGLHKPKEGDIAEVYSWEMNNLDLLKPDLEQVFIGPFAPAGYGYIFPKSKNAANVGVGGRIPKDKIENYFQEFLELSPLKKQLKNAEFKIEKSKKAVIGDIHNKWIYGNIIFTGDAANQNLKPFIEGILPSVICGDIAGANSFDLSNKKNITNQDYVGQVQLRLDGNFELSKNLQEMIFDIFSKNESERYLMFYLLVTDLTDPKELNKIEKMNYDEMKAYILEKVHEKK